MGSGINLASILPRPTGLTMEIPTSEFAMRAPQALYLLFIVRRRFIRSAIKHININCL